LKTRKKKTKGTEARIRIAIKAFSQDGLIGRCNSIPGYQKRFSRDRIVSRNSGGGLVDRQKTGIF
jgi:hypothetical protein